MKFAAPKEIEQIALALENAGFEAYFVGGCVRDTLMGRKPKDWDLTTDALPADIQKIFPESFYDNSFGTVSVKQKETEDETLKIVQITPYRKEGKYSDKRRPDEVSFSKDIKDDLSRRDFTMNALAYRPKTSELLDLYKGQDDVLKKVVRTVGDADTRFGEDALRMLRAIRFSCELGFAVSQETAESIAKNSASLALISKERIRDELIKVIMSPDPEYGLILMQKLGVLKHVIPELEEGVGMEQTQAHAYDVWTHLIKSVQAAAKKAWPLEIRLAALLHDVGKPRTRRKGSAKHKWTFYGHDVVGARMAKTILTDLKFPKETIETVVKLIRWHMFFSDTETITHSAVRRLIVQVGKEHIWDLMDLRVCDRVGTGRPKESPYRLRKYHAMIEETMRDPVSVGMLKVDGKVLMEKLGMTPGPRIGWTLHALLEDVLEKPELNTEETLLENAKKLSKLSDADLRKIGESGKAKKVEEDEKEKGEIRKKHFVE